MLTMLFAEAAGQNASVPLGCVLGVSVIITCQLGKAMVPRYLVKHFYRYFPEGFRLCFFVFFV